MYHARPADEADIFAASLPTALVKAAAIAALVQGLLMIPFALRLAFAISGGTEEAATLDYLVGRGTVGVMIGVHVVIAIASLACVRMISGKLWGNIVAMVVSPLCALASLLGLITGALAGLFGILLAVLTFVLAAVAIGDVRRMARAKDVLEKLTD